MIRRPKIITGAAPTVHPVGPSKRKNLINRRLNKKAQLRYAALKKR